MCRANDDPPCAVLSLAHGTAVGESCDACAIRLLHYEGTVEIPDADVTEAFTGVAIVKGTLAGNPAGANASAGGAGKLCDGTALTCEEINVYGLPCGFTRTAAAGSRTELGGSANAVGDCAIFSMDGTDVTGFFTSITKEEDTLSVTGDDGINISG